MADEPISTRTGIPQSWQTMCCSREIYCWDMTAMHPDKYDIVVDAVVVADPNPMDDRLDGYQNRAVDGGITFG